MVLQNGAVVVSDVTTAPATTRSPSTETSADCAWVATVGGEIDNGQPVGQIDTRRASARVDAIEVFTTNLATTTIGPRSFHIMVVC